MFLELEWPHAQDLCRLRLAPTLAELMDACDREDHAAVRDLSRDLAHAAEELRAFLVPPA